jgi:hypothetical protein
MAHAEADVEHADLDKHFSDLKLEVTRLNCFMEWETMAHQQPQVDILSTNGSAFACPAVTAPTNGPEGHYPYPNARDHELGVFT